MMSEDFSSESDEEDDDDDILIKPKDLIVSYQNSYVAQVTNFKMVSFVFSSNLSATSANGLHLEAKTT